MTFANQLPMLSLQSEDPALSGLEKVLRLDEDQLRYQALLPMERIQKCLADYDEKILITTSGGIQSGVLLTLFAAACKKQSEGNSVFSAKDVPVVLIDTGDLFLESIQYARQMTDRLGLSLCVLKHGLSPAEFEYNSGLLQAGEHGVSAEDAFDELTKVRPLSSYRMLIKPSVWIAGNRRDQAPSRSELQIFSSREEMARLYPLADISAEEIRRYQNLLDIPAHPLADAFLSVGNKSDTLQTRNAPYEKAGRHNGRKNECGLHERRARHGTTYILREGQYVASQEVPINVEIYASCKA